MNEQPKKRARAWIGWTLFVALLVYPLPIGPMTWFRMNTPIGPANDALGRLCGVVYYPLILFAEHSEFAMRLADEYEHWWIELAVQSYERSHPE